MKTERRFSPAALAGIEIREATEDAPESITGLAVVHYDGSERTEYVIDCGGGFIFRERILPGALDDVDLSECRCLFNHNADNLLARNGAGNLTLTKDARGLSFEAQKPDTTTGRDVAENIRNGNLSGCSFAFAVAENGSRWIRTDKEAIREVTKIDRIFDVGPVTYPAYKATETSVRQNDYQSIITELQQQDQPKPARRDDLDADLRLKEIELS